MKKSNLNDFFTPNTHGVLLERYTAKEFIDSMSLFLSRHHGEAIKIETHMENISYINVSGRKTAEFIARVVKLRRGYDTLKICIKDIHHMLNILICQEGGSLSIGEEEKGEIIILARKAGFYINIDENAGAIIIKCHLESPDTVTFGALDSTSGFYRELEEAFDRADDIEE